MNTYTLSINLKLTVEEGDHGKFVRLTRGTRWIVFSPSLWEKIQTNVYHMNSKNYTLQLTNEKEVNVLEFKDRRYVSFHSIHRYKDNVYDTYINLNEEEWQNCMEAMTKITFSQANPPQDDTPQCHDMKKVVLVNQRMKKTTLNPTALKCVQDHNNETYNQLDLMCDYCGIYEHMGDLCHCHKYNCKDCEPDNFCKTCDQLTVCSA